MTLLRTSFFYYSGDIGGLLIIGIVMIVVGLILYSNESSTSKTDAWICPHCKNRFNAYKTHVNVTCPHCNKNVKLNR